MKIAFFELEKEGLFSDLEKGHSIFYPHRLDEIPDVDVLCFRTKSKITKDVIDKLPNLKLIITRTVGVDHIDSEYAKEKNITVANIPDYGAHIIAEHAFCLLLAGMRKLKKANANVNQGFFSYSDLLGKSLRGKTLGVIGTGKIGMEVIKIAQGFGMEIMAYDLIKKEGIRYVDLNELLEKSDILTLHIPLTNETQYLVNKETIKKMKDGVILINTARGGLINTDDLIDALKSDKFYFVGLDVLENEEKFTREHKLLKFENVLITPHMAFYTEDALKNIYTAVVGIINDFNRNLKP